MLNLTLPNFPFVVAFAVKILGWKASAVGLMAALPHLCNCLQPLVLAGLARRFSSYQLLRLTFAVGALPWSLAGAMLLAGNNRSLVFACMLVLGTLASSVASVAWSAAISEIVPERLSGRYFARRNLIFGGWTLLSVMLAGHIVEWNDNSLIAFACIFTLAGFSRLGGLFFLTRMKFPPAANEPRLKGVASSLLAVLRDKNYLALCVFVGGWGMLLNASMPFYTMYVVDQLNLGIGTVVRLATMASLGALLTLKGWGRLCERFGNRPVLQVCALIWAVTALAMWSLARPGWTWHLYIGYVIVGAMTAGFQLTQFNLMIRLAPSEFRAEYVAVFLAGTSLLAAIGPVLGGELLKGLPLQVGQLLDRPIFSFHVLFALSAFGCVLMTNLLPRVREATEQPAVNVWREMRQMRTFNPMLSVLSVGELLLTPRGLVAIARRSIRTVRQQVRALEDVGEEIVSGSKKVLGAAPGIIKPLSTEDSSRNPKTE